MSLHPAPVGRRLGLAALVVAATAAAALYLLVVAPGRARDAALYAEARAVVDRHCIGCHSARPTNRAFPIAPKGVALDDAAQMRRHAALIRVRAVVQHTMPLANMTEMTEQERRIVGAWIDAGAEIP